MVEFFIDGDACPVKDEVIRVAERHGLKINIAGNTWIRFPYVRVEVHQEIVPKSPDAADDWIAENVRSGDIVITSDIPLASRCLEQGAFVIRPNGEEYTSENIGMALGVRDLNKFLRESGGMETFHRPFSKQDKSKFLSALENVVQKAKKSL